jgi:NAD(P)-dependent dehydrogenase (short-subunit alcohol dehydrogenase family)
MTTIATDRKALVTGGGAGFGLAIARHLLDNGAQVAIADIDERRLEAARADLGDRTLAIRVDVRDEASVRAAVTQAADSFGGLDTVVNCAGVIHIKPLEDVASADWDQTLGVNLKGAFLVSQASAPLLRASGRGRIVSISSDAGKRGYAWIQAYCASKFGLIGLTESLAVELATDQTTVNCVCPVGCPTTEMGKEILDWKVEQTGKPPNEILAIAAGTNPLGRNATEDDVAEAVMFFISEEASFLTGTALDVDGGAHLGFLPGA